jgi:hypothetical protein
MTRIKCVRCEKDKDYREFIEDSHLEDVCNRCHTDEELNDYIRDEISKFMDGFSKNEKQDVIRDLVWEQRRKNKKKDKNNGYSQS